MSSAQDEKQAHIGVNTPTHSEGSIPSTQDADTYIFGDLAHPPRVIRPLQIISAGFNICNSWSGVAASMFLAIFQGGPVTIIYGIILMLFVMGATALTLAELAARFPTAGGQYHWTALLAPKKISRGLSYTVGCVNVFGWIAICAGICIIIPQILLGIVVFYNNSFVVERWHAFLIYQALNITVLAYNLFVLRRAGWTHNIGFILSLLCFITFLITCLAIAGPKQPSSYVWTTFVNDSGWPDGIVFLTGQVNPNFMYSGLDGAIHLAEDAINAATAVPWALMSTIAIGFVTTFPFVVAMFYCISDFDAVLGTPTMVPIYEIWHQATKSGTAATIMVVLLSATGVFALNASQQTASRLIFSFARDDALIFSNKISIMHPKLGVPPYALLFNAVVVFMIGCVYLGSTTAFGAIIGSGLVLQQITFAIPAILMMYRKRAAEYRPSSGLFNLGQAGWVANGLTVAWSVVQVVMFNFPSMSTVTGSTMNYTSAVLGSMALFGVINWFVHAKKHYSGPKVDLTKFM